MDFSILSKYRGELMGIGILEVMLLHYFTLNNAPVPGFVSPLVGLVYVQGFLFLSGFGLFYSFSNDNDLKNFYKKRFVNVLIPYLIIAIPYYTYFFVMNQQDLVPVYSRSLEPISGIVTYFGRITTLGYWHEGNFNGMWYLALTVLLYLMYPVAHQVFRRIGGGRCSLIWLLIIAILACLYPLIRRYFPTYCEVISLALGNAYMFFVGMLFGRWSYYKEKIDLEKIIVLGVLCWIAPHFKSIMSMIIICYVLFILPQSFNVIKTVLKWFGKYTLEIYVLHLTLVSIFIILGDKVQLNYDVKILIAYLLSIILAIAVKKLSERVKKVII